jgi:hypothetical protein
MVMMAVLNASRCVRGRYEIGIRIHYVQRTKRNEFTPGTFPILYADELWTNEHASKQMLAYQLNESVDVSSRNLRFIEEYYSDVAGNTFSPESVEFAVVAKKS